MPNLPLCLYRKVAPVRLKSTVGAKVGSRVRFPSCGAAPEALPVCSGADWGRKWLSSGAQHDEWSSGWTWMQGPLGVGSGWSGVAGIVQRPLITSGGGRWGCDAFTCCPTNRFFYLYKWKEHFYPNSYLSHCGNLSRINNWQIIDCDTKPWYIKSENKQYPMEITLLDDLQANHKAKFPLALDKQYLPNSTISPSCVSMVDSIDLLIHC